MTNPLIKTTGFFLSQTQYGEKSVICRVFTRSAGIKSFILSRNPRKMTYNFPMQYLEIIYKNELSERIVRPSVFQPQPEFNGLLDDIRKQSLCMFFSEILTRVIYDHAHDDEIYNFTLLCVNDILIQSELVWMPQKIVGGIIYNLGISPQGSFDENNKFLHIEEGVFTNTEAIKIPVNEQASAIIYEILYSGLKFQPNPSYNAHRRKILFYLIRYIEFHATNGRKINSAEILNTILN